MQHTAGIAMAAVLLALSTASPTSGHAGKGSDDVSEVTAGLVELNNNFKKFGNSLENLETITRMIEEVSDQASQLTKPSPSQYFSVQLSEDITVDYELVVFDKAIDNPEGLYDMESGVFECRVPGVYLFSLSVTGQASYYNETSKGAALGIYLDRCLQPGQDPFTYWGQELVALTMANEKFNQGSTTVTLNLAKGDKVEVKGGHSRSHVTGHKYTTFSGTLIAPAK